MPLYSSLKQLKTNYLYKCSYCLPLIITKLWWIHLIGIAEWCTFAFFTFLCKNHKRNTVSYSPLFLWDPSSVFRNLKTFVHEKDQHINEEWKCNGDYRCWRHFPSHRCSYFPGYLLRIINYWSLNWFETGIGRFFYFKRKGINFFVSSG